MALELHKAKTDLTGILVSVFMISLGAAGIYWGHSIPDPVWKEVVKDAGGSTFGVGILAFLWEIFTKRSFRAETLALVNIW